MAKDKFTLMETVDLISYLDSSCSFAAIADPSIDIRCKRNVIMMLLLLSKEIDISEYDPYNFVIGYNELRYFSINSDGNPIFESNNTHDWDRGEDAYRVFTWEELTDYEKIAVEDVLKQIVKRYCGLS